MAATVLGSLLRPAASAAATNHSPIAASVGLFARLTSRSFATSSAGRAAATCSSCRSSTSVAISAVGHRPLSSQPLSSSWPRSSWSPLTTATFASRFGQPAQAPLGGVRSFCKGVFGYPPQKITKKYSGMHCHPGRPFGYPHPRKRQGKVKRLPNVRLRSYDYDILPDATGGYRHRPPYPPRVNRTIPVQPPYGAKKNPFPTLEHKTYRMRWKNIEYTYQPRLMRKPFGHGSQRWSGPVTRIEHHPGGHKTTTLVSHDRRLMPF